VIVRNQKGSAEILVIVVIVAVIIAVAMFLMPKYRVYSQELRGQAALAEARSSKQVQVEQARGELESSKLRAEAIEIIGKAAQEYPEYRNQEFIGAFGEALREGQIEQIIYVPTEANIPILEAGKRSEMEK
jgi:predicted lipid-binding transport protein (Tim44 family)